MSCFDMISVIKYPFIYLQVFFSNSCKFFNGQLGNSTLSGSFCNYRFNKFWCKRVDSFAKKLRIHCHPSVLEKHPESITKRAYFRRAGKNLHISASQLNRYHACKVEMVHRFIQFAETQQGLSQFLCIDHMLIGIQASKFDR